MHLSPPVLNHLPTLPLSLYISPLPVLHVVFRSALSLNGVRDSVCHGGGRMWSFVVSARTELYDGIARRTNERTNGWMNGRTDRHRLYNKHTFIQIDRQMDGHHHTLACSKPHPKKKINRSNNNRKGHKLTEKSNIYIHTYLKLIHNTSCGFTSI